MTRVRWSLHGDVNNQNFSLTGDGSADFESGKTQLRLVAERLPAGFDPALSQRICNFALAGYAASGEVPVSIRGAVHKTLHVRPQRIARLFDAAGEEVVRLEALTTLVIDDDGITVDNWMTGFSHLGADIVRVTGGETLTPAGPGKATGVSNFEVELADGTTYEGLTVVPYRFDREAVVSPAVRSITAETCVWTSDTVVELGATSRWTALESARLEA